MKNTLDSSSEEKSDGNSQPDWSNILIPMKETNFPPVESEQEKFERVLRENIGQLPLDEQISALLSHPNTTFRWAVAHYLSKSNDSRVLAAFKQVIDDNDETIQNIARAKFGKLPLTDGQKNLKKTWGCITGIFFFLLPVLFYGVVQLSIGFGLVIFNKNLEILSFLSFSTTISLFLSFVLNKLIETYAPKGGNIDNSHIWVEVRSGRKMNNATERQAYEHQHGQGSWRQKIIGEKKIFSFISFFIVCFSGSTLAKIIGHRNEIIGSGSDFYVFMIAFLISGLNYIAITSWLKSTEYDDYHSSSESFKIPEFNWGLLIILAILIILDIFATISIVWIYFTTPTFVSDYESITNIIFVISSLLIAVTSLAIWGFAIYEKKNS